MKTMIRAVGLALLLSSCASSPVKKFGKIQNGMDRTDVLEIAGSPTRTERFNGKEKWIYRFYDDDKPVFKQVTFDQSMQVIESGDDVAEAKRVEDIKASDQKRATSKPVKPTQGRTMPDIKTQEKTIADEPVMIENPDQTFKPIPTESGAADDD